MPPAASLTFLTPAGALVALLALVPLAALALSAARGRRAALALGLGPARWRTYAVPAAAAAAVCVLLGLAASRPVLRTDESRVVRTESQAMFVVDVSRSMLASAGAGQPTRLERAQEAVERLHDAVPDVPSGIAGLTDRVLPYAFPTADPATFASTLRSSVTDEAPPPQDVATVATSFAALSGLARDGYFDRRASRRTCVLVTDGESAPFASGEVARSLDRPRGCRLIALRIGGPDERIFRPDGTAEGAYRPDAAAASKVESLASATGGRAFDESELAAAEQAVAQAAREGPTARAGSAVATRALAPYLAAAAFLFVLVLVTVRLATGTLRKETRMSYDPSWQL